MQNGSEYGGKLYREKVKMAPDAAKSKFNELTSGGKLL